jgi:putative redox protein
MKASVQWHSGQQFKGMSDQHQIAIDTSVSSGGTDTGMNPKQLLLASVCGCTGMDIIGMLEKMRVPFTRLEISADAEQTTDHPKVFISIHLTYRCDVSEADKDKLMKAIELSQTRYCGVSIMLKKHCPVTYQVELS